MAKKVLIFTYYWPPAGGPGVQRFLKFCKYLPDFGWTPIVVTVKNGSYPYIDQTLEEDIPEAIRVVKTETFEPFEIYNLLRGKKGKSVPVAMTGIRKDKSFFQKLALHIRANYFIPDARVGWKKYAIKAGEKIIHEGGIDAIITTGPPHSTHLVGLELKRRLDVPHLADFRDPWTNFFLNSELPRSEKVRKKDKALETEVLQKADCITVISPGLREEFKDRASRLEVIYNGFDEDDIEIPTDLITEKFKLSYIGNYKPNQDVPALWQAIAELKEEIDSFKDNFRLSFTGILDSAILERIHQLGLKDIVETHSFVPHHEATKIMTHTNLLLFVIPNAAHNNLILTGKIFEYLATRSPMLSIGPVHGNAAKIVEESQRGEMMSYEDISKMKMTIKDHYETWLNNGRQLQKMEGAAYKKYSRKGLSKELAYLLNDIVK